MDAGLLKASLLPDFRFPSFLRSPETRDAFTGDHLLLRSLHFRGTFRWTLTARLLGYRVTNRFPDNDERMSVYRRAAGNSGACGRKR